jgi:predicted enzyme related to lactoylglutathione lyase
MLTESPAYSGFSSNDIAKAKEFYGQTLGLGVTEEDGMLALTFSNGHTVLIYPKDDHAPATYTTLNFPVKDIDAAVDDLASRGIKFERYGTGSTRTGAVCRAATARRSPGSRIRPATSSR